MLNRNLITWINILESRRLRTLTEKVRIRDILVTQEQLDERENRIGEFHSTLGNTETDDDFQKRILIHIKKMASLATDIHLEDNFASSEEWIPRTSRPEKSAIELSEDLKLWKNKTTKMMKADCKNNITRLSFNEYYFYPSKKRGPISLPAFENLVRAIEEMASGLPENLHLVLSSFPVVDSHRQVSNMTIHVQCNQTPVLHVFAKAISSNNEPKYSGTQPFEFCKNALKPASQAALENVKHDKNSINFSAPILCETAGAVKFWTLIDICADHELGIAKQALKREIASRLHDESQSIPEQITHMIISNSTFLYDQNTLSATVTHVDPTYHTLHTIASGKQWEANTPVIQTTGTNSENKSDIRCFQQREMDMLDANLLRPVRIYNINLGMRLALARRKEIDIQHIPISNARP